MIRTFALVISYSLLLISCGKQATIPQDQSSISVSTELKDTMSSESGNGAASTSIAKRESTVHRAFAMKPPQADPINLTQISSTEKQIVLFFPTQEEVQFYIADEADDTGIIILEQFESQSVKFIEQMAPYGCNISTVEMSDVYILLADKSIFKVERNSEETVCGVVLYQAGKAPEVLSGKLKVEAYVKAAKAYFGVR